MSGERPVHRMQIDEGSHQLGDCERGVGVIQMNCHMIREIRETRMLFEMALEDIGDRCADEEILLPQSQLTARFGAVVGVEHPGDHFVSPFDRGGRLKVARVEERHVESGGGSRLPKTQCAHSTSGVTRDEHIVSASDDTALW